MERSKFTDWFSRSVFAATPEILKYSLILVCLPIISYRDFQKGQTALHLFLYHVKAVSAIASKKPLKGSFSLLPSPFSLLPSPFSLLHYPLLFLFCILRFSRTHGDEICSEISNQARREHPNSGFPKLYS